jgi:hypothetical protein
MKSNRNQSTLYLLLECKIIENLHNIFPITLKDTRDHHLWEGIMRELWEGKTRE